MSSNNELREVEEAVLVDISHTTDMSEGLEDGKGQSHIPPEEDQRSPRR